MSEDSTRRGPLDSVIASARRISKVDIKTKKVRTGSSSAAGSWQDDAWDMYDLVGEQRFLATNLAGQLAKAHLYVGRYDPESESPERLGELDDEGDRQITPEDARAEELLQALGGTPAGRSQLLNRLAVNLFIPGEGWLVGIPQTDPAQLTDGSDGQLVITQNLVGEPEPPRPEELDWRMLSVSEVSINSSTEMVELQLDSGEKAEYSPDDLYLIRVWRPHPRRWWEADSPTRSSLPVLKELVGLTMHVSAQVDSRLAGAGLLALPQSVQRALANQAGVDPDSAGDMFTESLIEAMLTPIGDRASAAAVVPLVVTVPDEAVDKIKHVSFSQPLDAAAQDLRNEAIRRLALGQDAPPELLLGTGNMNHWGGWLVQSETVETHIAPVLSLICDALTTQYLWPALVADGMEEEQAEEYVVWFDVDHLIARPNRGADAQALHQRGAISDEALRRYSGFEESDAPEQMREAEADPALNMALDLVRSSPGLVSSPGLPALVEQIRAVLSGDTSPEDAQEAAGDASADEQVAPAPGDAPEEDEPSAGPSAMPQTEDDPPEIGGA